jgi:predicted CXXCH cytochrome family protein
MRRAVALVFWTLFLWIGCVEAPKARPRATTRPSDFGAVDTEPWTEALAGGLVGSKHDFSLDGESPRDLCLSCHTPHITAAKAPLLDRSPRAARVVSLRQAYNEELDSATLLCLSCHDGVTATDVYSSSHATQWIGQLGSSQLGAGPLSSHPIGNQYPLADAKYHGVASVQADGRIKLPRGRLQCISCHDPHNTERHPAMLVKSNNRSALCLACHRL